MIWCSYFNADFLPPSKCMTVVARTWLFCSCSPTVCIDFTAKKWGGWCQFYSSYLGNIQEQLTPPFCRFLKMGRLLTIWIWLHLNFVTYRQAKSHFHYIFFSRMWCFMATVGCFRKALPGLFTSAAKKILAATSSASHLLLNPFIMFDIPR